MQICTSLLTQEISLNKEFRIIPAGKFRAIDGRPALNQDWVLTEEAGRRIISDVAQRGQDTLIDYGHLSLKGGDALAAGWFRDLVWKQDGLYIQNARWTEAAKKAIQAQEYRYVSPVFTHTTTTFEVLSLRSIAITNTPALPQLTDLSTIALSQTINNSMEYHMDQDLNDAVLEVARVLGQCPIKLKEAVLAENAERSARANYIHSDAEIEKLARLTNRDFAEVKAELKSYGAAR